MNTQNFVPQPFANMKKKMTTDYFYLSKVLFLITFLAWTVNFDKCKRHFEFRSQSKRMFRVRKTHAILELKVFYSQFCK